MKKTLFIFLLILFIGCENNSDTLLGKFKDTSSHSSKQQREKLTTENVKLFVNTFKDVIFDNSNSTRATEEDTIAIKDIIPYVYKKDTIAFITNLQNDKGFILTINDKTMSPLAAFSEKGNMTQNNISLPFKTLMNDLFYVLNEEKSSKTKGLLANENTEIWSDLLNGKVKLRSYKSISTRSSNETIYPILNTEWGQGWGYNYYCPSFGSKKAPTGCVATAIAQIINYYKPSLFYVGPFPAPYKIDDKKENDKPSKLAETMFKIGEIVDMEYTVDFSSAGSALIPAAFKYYGFKSSIKVKEYDFTEVFGSLRKKEPVILLGIGTSGGHAWVTDGYKKHVLNGVPKDYIHMNWGWNGSDNAYFDNQVWYVLKGMQTPVDLNSDKQMVIGISDPNLISPPEPDPIDEIF